jgi:hypothetical protein
MVLTTLATGYNRDQEIIACCLLSYPWHSVFYQVRAVTPGKRTRSVRVATLTRRCPLQNSGLGWTGRWFFASVRLYSRDGGAVVPGINRDQWDFARRASPTILSQVDSV